MFVRVRVSIRVRAAVSPPEETKGSSFPHFMTSGALQVLTIIVQKF